MSQTDAIDGGAMCNCCERLNTEEERIRITEIYISTAGYYNFYANIIFCPECGKILKKYEDKAND